MKKKRKLFFTAKCVTARTRTCQCRFDVLCLPLSLAVKFLTNPKIGASTIAQKTAFLKDKGLGQSEIEAAMAQARLSAPAGTLSTSNGGLYTPAAVNIGRVPGDGEGQGEQPAWGWKEYFIAATVMTGAVVVAKDYVLPKLQGCVEVL